MLYVGLFTCVVCLRDSQFFVLFRCIGRRGGPVSCNSPEGLPREYEEGRFHL